MGERPGDPFALGRIETWRVDLGPWIRASAAPTRERVAADA
jgi:hypothetical protein